MEYGLKRDKPVLGLVVGVGFGAGVFYYKQMQALWGTFSRGLNAGARRSSQGP